MRKGKRGRRRIGKRFSPRTHESRKFQGRGNDQQCQMQKRSLITRELKIIVQIGCYDSHGWSLSKRCCQEVRTKDRLQRV